MFYRILLAPPGYPPSEQFMVAAYASLEYASCLGRISPRDRFATVEEARCALPVNAKMLPFEQSYQFLELWESQSAWKYLFVYGTLRRRSQHPMARRLADAAQHVGTGKIAGRLYDLGCFPGLKEPRLADDWVQGDVYDLGDNAKPTLREMDAYENAESPPPYERELAAVLLEDGRTLTVWVYWYRGEVREEQFIASGSYEQNCDPP